MIALQIYKFTIPSLKIVRISCIKFIITKTKANSQWYIHCPILQYFTINYNIHAFFYISNTFISNARHELAKNYAKTKQHPEAELSLFENYSLFSSTLSSKNNRRHTKKCTKKQMRIFRWCCMINNNENEVENKKINHKDMT